MPPEDISASSPQEPAPEAPQPAPESPGPVVEAHAETPMPEAVQSAPEPAPSAPEAPPAPAGAAPTPETAQSPTPTAQIPPNEPIAPEPEPIAPALTPSPSEPKPEPPSAAASASAPVIVQAGILHTARDLLVKARVSIQDRKRKKRDKIMQALNTKNKITNNEVEKLLHVSDATATRYLSALEKEGKIKQERRTGAGVSYSRAP